MTRSNTIYTTLTMTETSSEASKATFALRNFSETTGLHGYRQGHETIKVTAIQKLFSCLSN